MKKKLQLALLAFTCLVAGWGLAPASSQSAYPSCESLLFTSCTREDQVTACINEDGEIDSVTCRWMPDYGLIYR